MPATQCESLWKAAQRQIFTFLSSRYGLTVCVVGIFLTLVSALQFGEMALAWSKETYDVRFNEQYDNIVGKNFQDRLCLPQPIDIVYTWVNGTDPTLLKNLAELKLRLELERNMTEHAKRTQESLRKLEEEILRMNSTLNGTLAPTTVGPTTRLPAKLHGVWALPDHYALGILGLKSFKDESKLVNVHLAIDAACGMVEGVDFEPTEYGGLVQFSEKSSVTNCIGRTLTVNGGNITLTQAYLIGNTTADGLVVAPKGVGLDNKVLFALGSYKSAFLTGVPKELPTKVLRSLLEPFGSIVALDRWEDQELAAVTFSQRFSLIDLSTTKSIAVSRSVSNEWSKGVASVGTTTADASSASSTTTASFGRRHLLSLHAKESFHGKEKEGGKSTTLAPSTVTGAGTTSATTTPGTMTYHLNVVTVAQAVVLPDVSPSQVERDEQEERNSGGHDGEHLKDESDEVSTSRFQDNSELQYSLRSVEKFAPWVRHIYIVTNGQIPAWLNLDHPRISVVPHDDIFLNKSHLPTFSSPSIEMHLHRIPGLSKKFLYLNDDVMFGTEIWPDDFYTHSKGQKIYLAWPVPNCEEGCPSNWIGDKYCDVACNTSACDYDGGDCLGKSGSGRDTHQSWSGSASTTATAYCNQGCADSWMGDKYCDRSCDVPQCGFDAGDCGVEKVFERFPGIKIHKETTLVHQDVPAIDGKFPRVFHNCTVKEASFEGPDVLHAAVFSQSQKIMVLVIRDHVNQTIGSLQFTTSGTDIPHFAFNVSINTSWFEVDSAHDAGVNASTSHHAANGKSASFMDLNPAATTTTKHVTIVNGSTVNYWEMSNITTPATTTTAHVYPKHPAYSVPQLSNESILSLPASVQHALHALDVELENGDLTAKGYARRKYLLVEPYLHTMNASQSVPLPRRRLLAQLEPLEGAGLGAVRGAQPLGGFVYRNGMRVRADELELADQIANAKAKQMSFESDMKDSIRVWEAVTGQQWMNDSVPDSARSSMPWERKGAFSYLDQAIREHDWRSRRLLDTFGDSLKHVNKLYNKAFGYTARRVIAHMPHMLDRDILTEVEAKFWNEWDATSSHSLRSSNDMQYAFAYFYYLVGQSRDFNVTEHFLRLDTDRDGVLNVNELRTLITRIYETPTSVEHWHEFENILLNCSDLQPPLEQLGVGVGPEGKEVWVTERFLTNCSRLYFLLQKASGKETKYRYELDTDEHDIAFKMIRNNATEVLKQLDAIRRNPQKFVCLNDNVDHRKKSAADVVAALHNFYNAFFPLRSQFELAPGFRNRFLHVSELRAWRAEQARQLLFARVGLALTLLAFICFMFWGKIKHLKRQLFPGRIRLVSARV